MIDLAGPAFGLLIGALAVLATAAVGLDPYVLMFQSSWGAPLEQIVLGDVLYVNLLWRLVNLLPLRPLDGGNALLSLLHMKLRDTRRAQNITAAVGFITGLVAAIALAQSGRMFLARFAAYFTYQNFQAYQQASR